MQKVRCWSFSSKKCNFCVHPTPNFLVRDWHSKILVNLDRVLPVVRGKLKNETVATFSDVYDVCGPQFCHFLHLSSKITVNHAFKAKRKRFVNIFVQMWKSDCFGIIWPCEIPNEMKTVFGRKFFPTWCQIRDSVTVKQKWNLAPQAGISLVHFYL